MSIFLTGATGFLGGQLLKNLLRDTEEELYILARDVEKAEQLVRSFEAKEQSRVHVVEGDVTAPRFGMKDEDFEQLVGKVSLVYHLAALVRFDEELRDLIFSINYDGTKYVLDAATQLGAKRFIYVSTAYTVGKGERGLEQLYPLDHPTHNPYEESKVKSEHLVFDYADRMDVSIFRPAIIVGDSRTGEADSKFTLYGFMRALDVFKRRVALRNPDSTYRVVGNEQATSNLVPVNYVADILALAAEKAEPNTVYNITNPNPATNFAIFKMIKAALQFDQLDIIRPNERHDLSELEERMNAAISVFDPYLSRDFQFDDDNTQALLQGTSVEHLNLDDDTLNMIIRAYFKTK